LDLGHDVLGEARRSIPVASKPGCPQARVYLEAAEAPPLLTLELGPGGDTLGGASEGGMMWLTRMEAPY
jgi:hypothetical protein